MKNSGEKRKHLHQLILDEYFVNGFNGYKAVQSIKKNSIVAAKSMFNAIIKDMNNQGYIQRKRAELSRKTEIQNETILRELINWSYVDITDFIGLNKEEIKELPNDIRRGIQSLKITKRTYKDRGGKERTDEIIEIKLIDKIKAIEMINKHIGFYEKDNGQKRNRIDLNKIDTATLNVLYQAISIEE